MEKLLSPMTVPDRKTAPDDFRTELLRCWRAIPEKWLFLLLLGVWLAGFLFLGNSTFGYVDSPSLFAWLYSAYNAPNSDDAHGNLIPFIVVALFWWRRDELLATPKNYWPAALGLLLAAVVIHFVGYLGQQARISTVGMFLGIYALM